MSIRSIISSLMFVFLVATAPNALAQEGRFQQEMRTFIETAREKVKSVKSRYTEVYERIQNATDSEAVKNDLRMLVEETDEAAGLYGEESELWHQYDSLLEFVEERKAHALDMLTRTGDARWQERYDDWAENGTRLQDLREKILSEVVRAEAVARNARENLEYILDILLEEGVAAAIEELESVHQEFVDLNNNLEAVIEEASRNIPGTGD